MKGWGGGFVLQENNTGEYQVSKYSFFIEHRRYEIKINKTDYSKHWKDVNFSHFEAFNNNYLNLCDQF